MNDYKVGDLGISAIKVFEGLKLVSYKDSVGIATIGYGHKIEPGETFTSNFTESDAGLLLTSDLLIVEKAIENLVTVPLSQNQYDALADFIFNEGQGHFANSTLLKVLNKGNYIEAANQLECWDIAAGKIDLILLARRRCERVIFMAGTV